MKRVSGRRLAVVAVAAAILILGAGRDARAQGFISPFIGYNFGGDAVCPEVTGCEEKNLNLGVSFGAMGSVLGFEQEIGYAKNLLGESPAFSSNVLTVMSNLMINPKIGPIRPYVVGGVGLIKTEFELTTQSALSTSNNSFGWDLGGGLMGFFGEHVGIRGEIRYFHAFKDLEVLGVSLDNVKADFGRASAGLVLKF